MSDVGYRAPGMVAPLALVKDAQPESDRTAGPTSQRPNKAPRVLYSPLIVWWT